MENQFSTNQFHEEEQIDGKSQSQSDAYAAPAVITVGGIGQDHLLEIAKWTKFLAIAATIGLSLLLLLMLNGFIDLILTGDNMHTKGAVFAIIFLACYYYPLKKAFSMVSHVKSSVLQADGEQLEYGLDDLRHILKSMGVLTIIMLVPFALFIIVLFIGGIGLGISSILH